MEYQEVAAYNVMGNKSAKVNGVPMVPTPINDWNEGFVTRRKGILACECSPSFVSACESVIEKMPLYPFAHYFLALCLKKNGNQSWKRPGQEAKSILQTTTRIPGHHSHHDLFLDEVDRLLQD